MVAHKQNLIAAIDAKSIQISKDGGKSWSDFNSGLITDWTFADLEIKPPYLWALTSFFGNAYRRSLSDIITAAKTVLHIENSSFSLEQNFPNPVKNSTTIKYKINNTDKVELSVFDIYGKEILKLVYEIQLPGVYEAEFDASKLMNGTYFYRMNSGNTSQTRKFTVLRNL